MFDWWVGVVDVGTYNYSYIEVATIECVISLYLNSSLDII